MAGGGVSRVRQWVIIIHDAYLGHLVLHVDIFWWSSLVRMLVGRYKKQLEVNPISLLKLSATSQQLRQGYWIHSKLFIIHSHKHAWEREEHKKPQTWRTNNRQHVTMFGISTMDRDYLQLDFTCHSHGGLCWDSWAHTLQVQIPAAVSLIASTPNCGGRDSYANIVY